LDSDNTDVIATRYGLEVLGLGPQLGYVFESIQTGLRTLPFSCTKTLS